MTEISMTVRVDKVKEIDEKTEKTEKHFYVLEGRNQDKTGKFVIQTPTEIKGFKSGAVVDIKISNSQMSIEDFKGTPEETEEKE